MTWRTRVRGWYREWLRRRIPAARQVTLDQRRIFIFPTRYGFLFLTVAAGLFVGGINYENNLIMGLSFLLTSLFIVTILHTFRNLSGVTLRAGAEDPGYAGGEGALEVVLTTGDRRWHRSLWLNWPKAEKAEVSVEPGHEQSLWLRVSLPRRGRIRPGRLRIETAYPLGLLRAWSLVDLDHWCLAWPAPLAGGECPATGGDERRGRREQPHGSDDFQGLRRYVPGDSLRLVDWKAFARGQGLNTKHFADPAEGRRWLEWDRLEGVDPETRLRRLAWWVLQLDRENRPYGLRLPSGNWSPDRGPQHRRELLDALALYGEPVTAREVD